MTKRLVININGLRCRGIYEAAISLVFGVTCSSTEAGSLLIVYTLACEIDTLQRQCAEHGENMARRFEEYATRMRTSLTSDASTPLTYSTLHDLARDSAVLAAKRTTFWGVVATLDSLPTSLPAGSYADVSTAVNDIIDRLQKAVAANADLSTAAAYQAAANVNLVPGWTCPRPGCKFVAPHGHFAEDCALVGTGS